eukprot:7391580-Prymnesium_polylepis.3
MNPPGPPSTARAEAERWALCEGNCSRRLGERNNCLRTSLRQSRVTICDWVSHLENGHAAVYRFILLL